jgi:hypothetical protein
MEVCERFVYTYPTKQFIDDIYPREKVREFEG